MLNQLWVERFAMDLNQIEFWSFDQLVENVKNLKSENSDTFKKDLGQEMSNFLLQIKASKDFDEHEKTSKAWLSWCREQKNRVKVIGQDIPSGILGSKVNGTLYDIKVSTRGPDDAAYNKYPDLREKVARGNSVLHLHDLETKTTTQDGIIFALRKFTGGMGDEDETQPDDNYVWMKYFLKPLTSARNVICTRKANGEAAHLSVRYMPKCGFVLCVGSKNVHMIVRNLSDVDKYTDSRFMVAKTVAQTVLDFVLFPSNKDPSKLTLLLNFLHHTRLTSVFEILQPHYQHVEDLSYLGDKSELNLITFTSPYAELTKNDSLCALSPDVGLEFGRALDLKTVSYDVISADDAEERMEKIRKDYGYEGEVLYFLDSKSRVIGLVKKKTAWYVLARAVREKASAAISELKKSPSASFSPKKWEGRITQIQKWIGFSDPFMKEWITLGNGFIHWLVDQHKKSPNGHFNESLNVRGKFPIIWKRYLEEEKLTDKFEWS